eukprot:TRINITY_DN218_c0_g1_i1.p1 TRINITY_DN218_c0_g1~~TRINITY_DN218_c0_g1_i1.p1  ORF type:complete len:538 (+),score=77.70 TRINITY_DN218_c0_g1_i1:109-1614(+)
MTEKSDKADNELNKKIVTMLETWDLARQYGIPDLENYLEILIAERTGPQHVASVLSVAIDWGIPSLPEQLAGVFLRRRQDRKYFSGMGEEALIYCLSRNPIVASETDIVRSILWWSCERLSLEMASTCKDSSEESSSRSSSLSSLSSSWTSPSTSPSLSPLSSSSIRSLSLSSPPFPTSSPQIIPSPPSEQQTTFSLSAFLNDSSQPLSGSSLSSSPLETESLKEFNEEIAENTFHILTTNPNALLQEEITTLKKILTPVLRLVHMCHVDEMLVKKVLEPLELVRVSKKRKKSRDELEYESEVKEEACKCGCRKSCKCIDTCTCKCGCACRVDQSLRNIWDPWRMGRGIDVIGTDVVRSHSKHHQTARVFHPIRKGRHVARFIADEICNQFWVGLVDDTCDMSHWPGHQRGGWMYGSNGKLCHYEHEDNQGGIKYLEKSYSGVSYGKSWERKGSEIWLMVDMDARNCFLKVGDGSYRCGLQGSTGCCLFCCLHLYTGCCSN